MKTELITCLNVRDFTPCHGSGLKELLNLATVKNCFPLKTSQHRKTRNYEKNSITALGDLLPPERSHVTLRRGIIVAFFYLSAIFCKKMLISWC